MKGEKDAYPFLETFHLLFIPLDNFFRALDKCNNLRLEAIGKFGLVTLQQRIRKQKV